MRDIPRGKGYDKASIIKHSKGMAESGLNANEYARKNKMIPDFFVRSHLKYFPDTYIPYLGNTCKYCGFYFAYSVKTQKFCSPKCASDKKRDKEYFGGNRRKTVGLAERICQICGASPKKGIASHHTFGRMSDPKGLHLVALCKGCHTAVTEIGRRNFVDDGEVWEKLVYYCYLRKFGEQENLSIKVTINKE